MPTAPRINSKRLRPTSSSDLARVGVDRRVGVLWGDGFGVVGVGVDRKRKSLQMELQHKEVQLGELGSDMVT